MAEKQRGLVEARTLKGFRDVLPAEALLKEQLLQRIKAVFLSFGYAPIETPHLEHTDVLIGETSGDIGKQLYRFPDQGGRDICLRFDLTVPFARFIVQHKQELGVPFKRYAIGNVFRGEQPQFGRYREFTQCDFDFVGVQSLAADAEIIEIIAAILDALSIPDFTIRINNRKAMNGLAEWLGVREQSSAILRILDKIDKIGREAVEAQLRAELALSDEIIKELMLFMAITAQCSQDDVFREASRYKERNESLREGLEELERVAAIVRGASKRPENVIVDFSVARGLGYYTGIVYETYLKRLPEIGSVCSGGRYDNLTMNFAEERLPGVGASVGLDRLIAALQKLELMETEKTPARVLMTLMSEADTVLVHRLAAELRAQGVAVEVYPEPAKLKKQFQYADRKGHPFVIVVGEQELSNGTFTVKDMRAGSQTTYNSLPSLLSVLRDRGPRRPE